MLSVRTRGERGEEGRTRRAEEEIRRGEERRETEGGGEQGISGAVSGRDEHEPDKRDGSPCADGEERLLLL